MILIHFSKDPFVFDPGRTYLQQKGGNDKPTGLWLSDESNYGWKHWCESEDFMLNALKHAAQFDVDPSRVIVISNFKEINAFKNEYGVSPSWASSGIEIRFIDWEKVSEKYAGVVITPYINRARLITKFFWYYGWDCASGCIWDLSAIRMVDDKRRERSA